MSVLAKKHGAPNVPDQGLQIFLPACRLPADARIQKAQQRCEISRTREGGRVRRLSVR